MSALDDYRKYVARVTAPWPDGMLSPVVFETADAAIAELEATNKRLNRRAQLAESAVIEKIQTHPDASFGRILANAGYSIALARAQRAEADGKQARYNANRYRGLMDQSQAELAALREALEEVAKGEGRFSRDPLTHAANTIEDMKNIALAALHQPSWEARL